MKRIIVTTLIATISLATPALAEPDWQAVGEALGKEGTVQPDGIYRVGLPRSDLKVQLDGVEIKPALALGTWLAFQPVGDTEAMVMGDLVLTHEEINPVMKVLAENGIEITALHNHLLRSEPATRGQNKSCSKSYAKTERSGNVMQRGGFFQEVAMA
ncbi:DUF1259 domain-containing protein [Brucella anthropi]|uniref:DUF1259 domain-containing protein n=1 Tax=Brucella anthropi TaxID=529 RepID=UPI000289DA6F